MRKKEFPTLVEALLLLPVVLVVKILFVSIFTHPDFPLFQNYVRSMFTGLVFDMGLVILSIRFRKDGN